MLKEKIDPFTTEIIRAGIVATTDEMKTNLMRTAYNPIVYEALDFTVALTDAQGNLVSIGLGLPSFIRGISETVKAFVKFFGDDIHPGDILLTNDAYIHGSHLNHVITAMPVFHDERLVGFSCSEPHWADIGGSQGGQATEIFTLGLQIPCVKLYKRGELNKQIVAIIQQNVRSPERAMGDLRGQVACVRTGEKRILYMVKKYGVDTFLGAIDAIFDQSEEFSKRAIDEIPDGVYEAESFMDDDGVDIGVHLPVKIKITVEGEHMTIDLSGLPKQVKGGYNSRAGVSGAQMGFKTITSPLLRPVNDGSFRPLDVILPEGRVVSATKPAAIASWMIIPTNIADTIWKALAPAVPNKVAAGHYATQGGGGARVIDPKTGRPAYMRITGGSRTGGGGWGAKYNEDGMCATIVLNDGDTHDQPTESLEAENQTEMMVRLELRQDSGGAGKFRGGLSSQREIIYLWDSTMNSGMERSLCPPWGLFGAKDGLANRIKLFIPTEKLTPDVVSTSKVLRVSTTSEEYPNPTHPNAKVTNKNLPAGSRILTLWGGGGGFGNPLERSVEKVRSDVVNGYVSLDAARNDYGVVLDANTLTVDQAATKALRAKA